MIRTLLAAVAVAAGVATADGAEPLAPGTVFRDCPVCPELVVIPAGEFVMGAGAARPVEGPAVGRTIERRFALGRFEVTFDEWQACVDQGGCAAMPDDHGWGRGPRPVINVSMAAVEDYLHWLTARTGQRYRLPSEAEWAYANRAGTTATWWWGHALAAGRANCRGCPGAPASPRTMPVGQFPANPFGLYDTAGNVLEWVADCWHPRLTAAPDPDQPSVPEQSVSVRPDAGREDICRQQVVRGGAWYYWSPVARSAWRGPNDPRVVSYTIGFRVVRDLRSDRP